MKMNAYATAHATDLVTMNITLLPHQIPLVYAVLGQGVSLGAVAAAYQVNKGERPETVLTGKAESVHTTPDTSQTVSEATDGSSDDRLEIDADGHPFDAKLHTGTITKAGLWRMKAGVARPAPMPGFPKTETPSETSTISPASPVADGATEPAGSLPTEEPASVAASLDEDDEFAAFREATAKVDAAEAAAAANVPARVWTDADLGALCNQAAVKMGEPGPVKALIAEYVPAGEVAHSRNIPADKRAAFVKAVEEKAGIEFAG